ncbi:hypothetical protein OAH18_03045 [bacterium]|nr:hypothetical protein [bacterium]
MKLTLALLAIVTSIPWARAEELPENLRRNTTEILGTINSSDNACRVRAFVDPYMSLAGQDETREYRWRIHVPDGSKFNLLWASGNLPKTGVPQSGQRLVPDSNPLPSSAGDVVVVIRAKSGAKDTFEISVYPEFPDSKPSLQSTYVRDAKWLPYFQKGSTETEHLDRAKETRLNVDRTHQLMAHYRVVEGSRLGYGIWLEFETEEGRTTR